MFNWNKKKNKKTKERNKRGHFKGPNGRESSDNVDTEELEDLHNDETFGNKIEIGNDFKFQENNYEEVVKTQGKEEINEHEFMEDLWGKNNTPIKVGDKISSREENKKMMSLEEVESKLTKVNIGEGGCLFDGFGLVPVMQYGGFVVQGNNFYPVQKTFEHGQGGLVPFHVVNNMGVDNNHVSYMNMAVNVEKPNEKEFFDQEIDKREEVNLYYGPKKKEETIIEVEENSDRFCGDKQIPETCTDNFSFNMLSNRSQKYSFEKENRRDFRRNNFYNREDHKSEIMNLRDKDFIVRFQLSQIVTDDPYNEDFYAQVYKNLYHSKDTPKNQDFFFQQSLDQNSSLILSKNFSFSLQNMQNQIQKAIISANGKNKSFCLSEQGVLGKISFSSFKKPKKQLEINFLDLQNDLHSTKMTKLSVYFNDHNHKFEILSYLENVLKNVILYEIEKKNNVNFESSSVWDSLMFSINKDKDKDKDKDGIVSKNEVHPFLHSLNYNKGVKILPSLFIILNRDQVSIIMKLLISNLLFLNAVKKGSHHLYPKKKLPVNISNMVDFYFMIFSKIIFNTVLEYDFNEIIILIQLLVENNDILFLVTTKIGLSIITILFSRAELLISEEKCHPRDLLVWSFYYDQIFNSIEPKLKLIFPAQIDISNHGSDDDYIWQFLSALFLSGKPNHQRLIVAQTRDEIFNVLNFVQSLDSSVTKNSSIKKKLLNNLNIFLLVMGLVADENEIKEL